MISKNEKVCNFVTQRQAKALPLILSGRTVGEGCEAAGISRKSFYNWMKGEAFRNEYRDRQRNVVELAMLTLRGNAVVAAEKLSAMVATEGGPLLRRVCRDVIDLNLKIRELDDLETRLEALEKKVAQEA